MGFSCGDEFDKKETQVPLRDEIGCSVGGGHEVVPDSEFKPIDHPLEPSDEDRPVKCPMPDSSLLNDGGMWKERFTESFRKRADLSSVVNDESMMVVATEPPARAVRKRHHTLTRDHTIPPLFRPPPLPTQSTTIFQVLRQCNEFES